MSKVICLFGFSVALIVSGCTSAQIEDYNYNLKHALDWTETPANQEKIKYWYFNVLGFNPYEMLECPTSETNLYRLHIGLEKVPSCIVNRSPSNYMLNPITEKQNDHGQ